MNGFDAHCHLDLLDERARADEIARAHAVGVTRFALAGADPHRWGHTLAVGREIGAVVMLGLHPWFVAGDWPTWVARLPEEIDGIGEIGLDYSRAGADRSAQRAAFRAQLAIARERDLPVALHWVGAIAEGLAILRRDGLPSAGGLVHGWASEEVEEALGLGLHLSVGTRELRKSKVLSSLIRIPPQRLLLESDAPEARWQGRASAPADLLAVAALISARTGRASPEILRTCGENAASLLERRIQGFDETLGVW